jgi:hypothetical protein
MMDAVQVDAVIKLIVIVNDVRFLIRLQPAMMETYVQMIFVQVEHVRIILFPDVALLVLIAGMEIHAQLSFVYTIHAIILQ